ncbi:MAG TPA: histidine phosphatase family protein [Parvularculaceae bacterium]|nr:histidine phosphatase family protein [Parvularculaceae bacterium]
MTGRIITARHGRPNLSRNLKISAADYGDWWARYDASGLHPDEEPPQALIEMARGATTVLSSTLPRAIETAREVTRGQRDVPADPIFVEAPLPPPPAPSFVKLSPGQWGVVSRALWCLGYAPPGVESEREAWRRASEIAERLGEHARGGDVLLCAHGFLNWMLDRRLKRAGWRQISSDGGNHYWSWRIYEARGDKAPSRAPAVAE